MSKWQEDASIPHNPSANVNQPAFPSYSVWLEIQKEQALVHKETRLVHPADLGEVLCAVKCNDAVFTVPKHLLCAQSSYFKAALEGHFKEAREGIVDLSAEDEKHLRYLLRHLLGDLSERDLGSFAKRQYLELVDVYSLACRLGADIFARMCVYFYEKEIGLMAHSVSHSSAWVTDNARVSGVLIKLGEYVEALYGYETSIPMQDRRLREPLVQLATWVHHRLVTDEQTAQFEDILGVSGTFALEIINKIKSGTS